MSATPALPHAFFVPDGDAFVGTEATAGPWDPQRSMHFGPPAALLGRAAAALPADTPRRVVRTTFEILRPVPIGRVRVRAAVDRPGRRIDLVSAVLTDDAGVELALCRAWRIREADVDVPRTISAPPPGPEVGQVRPFFAVEADVHYGAAMEVRFLTGAFLDPGPADVWMRARVPLIAGEETSPLSRVLVAADSGNGVSAVADPRDLLFVNTDLTVHLHRHPVGEWILLRAATTLDGGGSGLATTRVSDERGDIGTALQSLFVAPAR
ncbi:MAG TPA: thioesterase family protein [Euzebyales bacterium]